MSTEQNLALLKSFYRAFAARDAATMARCYHDELRFSDPAFIDLNVHETRAMWAMLCERAQQFSLSFEARAEGNRGSVDWIATYLFSQTGRMVENRIRAELEFRDGLIVRHTDHFDFYRWSRQALGAPGWLLGWSGLLRKKVQTQARKGLTAYMAKNP
jgi:ketosteroid isomerase-like protein